MYIFECALANLDENTFNKELESKSWNGKLYYYVNGNKVIKFEHGIDSDTIKSYVDLRKYFSYENLFISAVVVQDSRVDIIPNRDFFKIQNIINKIKTLDPENLIIPTDNLYRKTESELQDILDKLNDYKKDIEFIIKQHENYKSDIVLGYIFWPLSIFIIPFILGMIIEGGVIGGISFVLLSSFTYPILLPISFAIAFFIHPHIVQSFRFQSPSDKKHNIYPNLCSNFKNIYYDNIAKNISISSNELKKYATSAIAATALTKVLSK